MSLPTPPKNLKNVFAGYYLALWNYLNTLAASITGAFFANGGNSFGGAGATLGTNDSDALRIRTNGLTRMTINGTGAIAMGGAGAPGVGAIVDVQSTTGGQLLPRMTTAQRDLLLTSRSLTIFNIDTNEFEFWNGAAWQPLGPPITRAQWADATSTLVSATQYLDRWLNPVGAATHGSAPQAPIEGAPFALSSIAYSFVGDGTNAGQTIQFELLVNGAPVAGAITGALPTNVNPAATTGVFTFPTRLFPAGAVITCAMILTGGPLTAAVTSLYVSAGG